MRKILFVLILLLGVFSVKAAEPTEVVDTLSVDKVEVVGSGLRRAKSTNFVVDSIAMVQGVGRSVGDLLRTAMPVVVRSYGKGQKQSISFRGTAPTHTSLYWNSMKINSPVVGDVDFSLLPASGIDKLSVAPGVSAIAYGDGALGGVVDMKSVADWSTPFSGSAIVGIGSFNSYNASVGVRAGSKTFQSSTKLVYNYSLNDFEFINRDIIDPSRPDYRPTQKNVGADYQNMALTQDFFFMLGGAQVLSASVMAVDNWRNIPQLTTYEGGENSNKTRSSDRSVRAVVNYKKYGEKLNIEAMIGGTIEGNEFSQMNQVAQHEYEPYIDSHSSGKTVQGNVALDYTINKKHGLNGKVTGLWQSARSSEEVRGTGFDESRAEVSASAEWEAQWAERFSTSLLGRTGLVGENWCSSASAVANFSLTKEMSLFVRGGYNEHYPSLQDMYYTPGGNPDLKPEKAVTAEVGATFGNSRLRVVANVYGSLVEDWIVWLPTHAQYWTPTNLREVMSLGAEAQVNFSQPLGGDWNLNVNGTATFSRTMSVGERISVNDFAQWQQLPFVPMLSGAASVTVEWRNVSLGYRVEGETEKFSATSASTVYLARIEPYDIHSLQVNYKPWEFLSASVECNNIFDGQFYGIMRRPLPPRSFSLTVKYIF